MTPVRRKRIDIAFFPRILVPADDHGPAVLPQEQDALSEFLCDRPQQIKTQENSLGFPFFRQLSWGSVLLTPFIIIIYLYNLLF